MGSTDVNSAIENDLDSDDEKDDIRMEKRESTSLLFVYQTDWQKRLFARYGNELVLLDATYRTTRYAVPLFFLVVKTNIDYQVVAIFVTENEWEDSIKEALTVTKIWNQDVSPKYGMTDYCVEEINNNGRCLSK